MAPKYDHFRKFPDKACQCGTPCGLTFKVTHSTLGRKYHPDCAVIHQRKLEYNRAHSKLQAMRKKGKLAQAADPPRQAATRKLRNHGSENINGHRKVKTCRVCFNLPDRRPPEGCASCGFPYQADEVKR